jgi:hypothetical protein
VTGNPIDPSLITRIKIGHQPRLLLFLIWFGMTIFLIAAVFPDGGWIGYLFFSLMAIGLIGVGLLTLPQFNYIELRRDAFVVRHGYSTQSYRWRDVGRIEAIILDDKWLIGFDVVPPVPVKKRERNRAKYGFDVALTDHYELSQAEIVDMMLVYKERA